MALSSVYELQNQVIIARDLKYITKENFNELDSLAVETSKLVNSIRKGAPTLDSKF